jgi:recombination protein RecT
MSKSTALVESKVGLKALLEQAKPTFGDLVPAHVTPEKLMKLALVAASRNPDIYKCTKASIITALTTAAELGLNFTGVKNEGYIVTFSNKRINAREAQFMPGYGGLRKLAMNHPDVVRVDAQLVHERDEFEHDFGLTPKLRHVKCLNGDPGKIVCAYCVVELRNAQPVIEIMSLAELDGIRTRSRASGDGPWKTDPGEMYRKTVLKRACKHAPYSIETPEGERLEKAIGADHGAVGYPGEEGEIIEGTAEPVDDFGFEEASAEPEEVPA